MAAQTPRSKRIPIGVWLGVIAFAIVVAAAAIQRTQSARPQIEPPGSPTSVGGGVAAKGADPFRDVPRDTTAIAWHTWAPATFDKARRAGQSIAVLVDVAWGESCVLYARAIALDPAVRTALDAMVAIRVDADHRPDIFERYCASSLPAWVLLAPDGSVMQIIEALPPADLARRLRAVQNEPPPTREDPGVATLQAQVPVPPPASDLAAAAHGVWTSLMSEWPAPGVVLEADAELWDGDALDLLAQHAQAGEDEARRAYADALTRAATQVASAGALEQDVLPVAGRIQRGRFLATHATWLIHWQRMAAAGNATPAMLQAAATTRAWMDSTLWDETRGWYRGAQGTLVFHDGKPALNSAERARMGGTTHSMSIRPHVVAWYPVGGNARAAIALLETGAGAPDAAMQRARGRRILDAVRSEWRRRGQVPHDFTLAEDAWTAGSGEWMGDVADLGRAVLVAAHATGDVAERRALHRDAEDLATLLVERFVDPTSGLLMDIPAADPGVVPARMRVRLAPLADGGRGALFLCEVAAATGDARWLAAARTSAAGWTRAVRGHSAFAAAPFAAAAARLADRP